MKLPDSPYTIKGDDMDALSNLPRISQSDLLQRAAAFADQMMRELEAFNHNLAVSDLTETERQKLKDASNATYPMPQDMKVRLEEVFLFYMQGRCAVIPDP